MHFKSLHFHFISSNTSYLVCSTGARDWSKPPAVNLQNIRAVASVECMKIQGSSWLLLSCLRGIIMWQALLM